MKRNIEVWSSYDANGRWCLCCRKKRGHFTLDELTEVAREWEEDFYAIIIKAVSGNMEQYFDVDYEGDYVTLYRATDFLEGGR